MSINHSHDSGSIFKIFYVFIIRFSFLIYWKSNQNSSTFIAKVDIVETPWWEQTSFHCNTHKSEIKENTERTKQNKELKFENWKNKTKQRMKVLKQGWGLRRLFFSIFKSLVINSDDKAKLCFFQRDFYMHICLWREPKTVLKWTHMQINSIFV